jgi:hypothetical protein
MAKNVERYRTLSVGRWPRNLRPIFVPLHRGVRAAFAGETLGIKSPLTSPVPESINVNEMQCRHRHGSGPRIKNENEEARITLIPMSASRSIEPRALSERLAHGKLPGRDAFRLAMSLAEALRRIHDSGQVHGALTPLSIVTTASGVDLIPDRAGPPRTDSLYRAGTAPRLRRGPPLRYLLLRRHRFTS